MDLEKGKTGVGYLQVDGQSVLAVAHKGEDLFIQRRGNPPIVHVGVPEGIFKELESSDDPESYYSSRIQGTYLEFETPNPTIGFIEFADKFRDVLEEMHRSDDVFRRKMLEELRQGPEEMGPINIPPRASIREFCLMKNPSSVESFDFRTLSKLVDSNIVVPIGNFGKLITAYYLMNIFLALGFVFSAVFLVVFRLDEWQIKAGAIATSLMATDIFFSAEQLRRAEEKIHAKVEEAANTTKYLLLDSLMISTVDPRVISGYVVGGYLAIPVLALFLTSLVSSLPVTYLYSQIGLQPPAVSGPIVTFTLFYFHYFWEAMSALGLVLVLALMRWHWISVLLFYSVSGLGRHLWDNEFITRVGVLGLLLSLHVGLATILQEDLFERGRKLSRRLWLFQLALVFHFLLTIRLPFRVFPAAIGLLAYKSVGLYLRAALRISDVSSGIRIAGLIVTWSLIFAY